MRWQDQLFNYCERGADSSFWAEPFNAGSNLGFVLAGILAARRLARSKHHPPIERLALLVLVVLAPVIGFGSFVFHTFATRWALIADVGPITAFMIGYLVLALRLFLGLGWTAIAFCVTAFLGIGSTLDGVTCDVAAGSGRACLNGSLGYLPAFVSLVVVAALTHRSAPSTGRTLLGASAVFFASLLLRTIDFEACNAVFPAHAVGTHAAWHLLNALTLYLLLTAAIENAGRISSH
ncbi:MAG: ceramidase domain-containing protein [Proteobacteria bacterium]|nr:ceramidase domain-containing protein [Pseudomonadota bacterium]